MTGDYIEACFGACRLTSTPQRIAGRGGSGYITRASLMEKMRVPPFPTSLLESSKNAKRLRVYSDVRRTKPRSGSRLMSSETTQLPKPNFGVKALVSVETRVRYALSDGRTTIGRAEDNQICLNCDVYASSHHAEITFDGEAFWLNDLG